MILVLFGCAVVRRSCSPPTPARHLRDLAVISGRWGEDVACPRRRKPGIAARRGAAAARPGGDALNGPTDSEQSSKGRSGAPLGLNV